MVDPSDATEPTNRHMTRDRDRIRNWVEGRDGVPVTVVSGEAAEPEYTFLRRDAVAEDHEERTWEEFFETFEAADAVFAYGEESDLESAELLEQSAAVDRAGVDADEFESALLEGETVTTERVETRVVEREVVETDTIESEVVDTEVLSRDVVASEVLDREILDAEFVGGAETAASPDAGDPDAEAIDVEVDERRVDTVEEIERLTVESRIIDVDVEVDDREMEDEEIEDTRGEMQVSDETIHRAIFEEVPEPSSADGSRREYSLAAGSFGDVDELIESDRIRTNREGDAVESMLVERRTTEEEVRDRRRMRFVPETAEIIETEVTGGEVIDAELLDVAEYEDVETVEPAAGERGSAMGTAGAAGATGAAGRESGAERAGGTEPAADVGADAGATTDGTVNLTDADRGKAVVDEAGEQVGIVADVDDEHLYVDPEPGLTDRLKARFGWGEPDRDAYPVERSEIRSVTADEVVLSGE